MFKGSEKGLKGDPLCVLGVRRVRQRVKKTHANEAQTHIQGKAIRTPELTKSFWERHGHHNAMGNYLGHPCFGKLYHQVATLLEKK
jgi:hypothetical protein